MPRSRLMAEMARTLAQQGGQRRIAAAGSPPALLEYRTVSTSAPTSREHREHRREG
jgi:hypothetical protein